MIAALSGHTHRNQITPRPTADRRLLADRTASLIDYPQQARALRVLETAGGGVAIQTWMLDHVDPAPARASAGSPASSPTSTRRAAGRRGSPAAGSIAT